MALTTPFRRTLALAIALSLVSVALPFGSGISPAFAAPSGSLTISDAGGDSLPAPSGGVYEITSNISVPSADIESALGSGNVVLHATEITVASDIDAPNTNSLTLKSSGSIVVNGAVDITSQGGDLIFWADSDSGGDVNTASGHIAFGANSSVSTGSGGGDIVLGGQADDDSDGSPDGYAFGAKATGIEPWVGSGGGTAGSAAIFLTSTDIDAGSGDVVIRGHGTGQPSNFQMGVWFNLSSITASSVVVRGNGSTHSSGANSSLWGVLLSGTDVQSGGGIDIQGTGGGAPIGVDTNQHGVVVFSQSGTPSTVEATGSGSLAIAGFAGGGDQNANGTGLFIGVGQTIQSDSGDISLEGTASKKTGQNAATVVSTPVSSSGNISVEGKPHGTTGLIRPVSIAGLTATLGTVSITSPGAVTQSAAITATSLSLRGAADFTLTNTSNAFGTLAAGSDSSKVASLSIFDASGGLTVGSVGPLEGVSATGDVLVETGAGDITLAKSIATDSTSSTAITLNAGDSTVAGTDTGGNIVISGSPTLTTGTGGIVRLFSGSEADSTGLTALAGGASNTYFGVDETSTPSPALSSGTTYALYRGKETPQLASLNNQSVTVGASNATLTAPSATNKTSGSVAGSTTWSSSNSSVASISGSTLTYGSAGTAVITATFTPTDTATYQSATATFTVTVSVASSGGSSSSSSSSATPATPAPVVPVVTPQPTRLAQTAPNTDPVTSPVERLGLVFDPDAASRATIGDVMANLLKTPLGPSALSLAAGGFEFGVRLNEGSGAEVQTDTPSDSPELFVPRGDVAEVSGKGSYPGSLVQVWLPGEGNDSRELARIPVGSDGTFESGLNFEAGALELPVPIGRQVLQVVGYDEQGNQTVVDMTINIGQGVPAPEPNRQAGAVPDLSAGESLATSGGIPESVSLTGVPETGSVVVEGNEWVISVNADRDNGVVEDADGNLRVQLKPSSVGTASGSGFLPGTLATVWLFSEPTLMTTVTIDENGEFSSEFLVDARLIAPGEHTLQVQGVGADGYIKAANLGVLVEQPVDVTTESASGLLWWVAGAFFLLLLVVLFVIVARRRRA